MRPNLLLAAGAALLATACLPPTAQYLSIPVQSDQTLKQARVQVPLDELTQRLDPMDPDRLAFYSVGRTPTPHRLVDRDGDGAADAAEVEIDVRAGDRTRLIAVHPAPEPAAAPLSAGDAPAGGVQLDFDAARR